MGLLDTLQTKGSLYTPYDGSTPIPNLLATKASLMHAGVLGQAGYSLNGTFATTMGQAYAEYDDGVVNPLPQPSQLDLNGVTPPKYKNPETGTTYP
jgi:hypothetical protein